MIYSPEVIRIIKGTQVNTKMTIHRMFLDKRLVTPLIRTMLQYIHTHLVITHLPFTVFQTKIGPHTRVDSARLQHCNIVITVTHNSPTITFFFIMELIIFRMYL